MEDQKIMELYWARDERAIAETDAVYGPYCYAIADRILASKEDSEETVNDTWLRAWEAMPPQRPNYLKLFLAKITRNLAFNRWETRKAAKRGGGEIDLVLDELKECVASCSSVEGQVEAAELERCIQDFVRALPARERNLFVRRYFFTEPIVEIAKRYDMGRNTVAHYLERTRRDLRDKLREEGYVL